jgi:hypothetical protein
MFCMTNRLAMSAPAMGRMVLLTLDVFTGHGSTIMHRSTLTRQRGTQRCVVALAAAVWLQAAGARAGNVAILFTASTDYTGGVNPISAPNDPTQQNPYLPALSPGVSLSPNPALLDGNLVGPLPDGSTYGPFGYNGNTGGTTGFVTTTYTIPTSGVFQLVWEVANVINCAGNDALATDNIRLNGTEITQFQPGGNLPAGFSGLGSYGTSGAVTGLAPSGGDPAFAWMDVSYTASTGIAPIFDTVDGYSASRLYSATFTATAGSILSLDVAFMTSDGSPYNDYGVVALVSVPEPSSLTMTLMAVTISLAGRALFRRFASARGS